jgi:DNA-directed RNA polymerase subunit F
MGYNKHMTTKDTMTPQIQSLALAYAEKMIAYYTAESRKAYDELCDAQNTLAHVVQVQIVIDTQ